MNELNLYQLFSDIVKKSKTIRRYKTATNYGQELNSNNLGDIIKDSFGGSIDGVKYPICLAFPPVEHPNMDTNWSRYRFKLFFLAQPSAGNSGTLKRNAFRNTSEHTIEETWKDMTLCAKDFKRVLNMVTERSGIIREASSEVTIQRLSGIGNDGVAGVGLYFDLDATQECDLTDYDELDIASFTINQSDIHPHHDY